MKLKEILSCLLEEQKKTNALLASIKDASSAHVNASMGRSEQADTIMQQALSLLNQHIGDKN